MSLPVKASILRNMKSSYAVEGPETQYTIDCGDGINALSVSDKTREAFERLDFELVKGYPHTVTLKEKIRAVWADYAVLTNDRIVLGEGSQTFLYDVNRLFLNEGDQVLGIAPTYAEVPSDVSMWGCRYDGYVLQAANRFRLDPDAMLAKLDGRHKLIYIDNPNNPTGQILPLKEIRRFVAKAAAFETPILIDEAYGDYMVKENSAIQLVNEFDNLMVVRSFSKGYGLAGLRAGYGILPEGLTTAMDNITHPYIMSSLSRAICEEVITDEAFLKETRRQTAAIKTLFYGPWKRLSLCETDSAVCVCLVTHYDPGFRLKQAFDMHGIKVVSGDHFLGLGQNSVRFRIPVERDIAEVLRAFQAIDALV